MEEERAADAENAASTETEQSAGPEPLDPITVQSWLARIRPAAVLGLLKDPDYSFAVSRVFLGFRPDAKGYANPLVRSRLLQAALKDAKLGDKLRELAEAEPDPAPIAAKPPLASSQDAPTAAEKPDRTAALRAERDQRRRERDEARQALAQVQSEREAAAKSRLSAEAERDEAASVAKKQADRIARLERQVAKLQQSETRLLKALSEDKVSPPPPSPARFAGSGKADTERPISPWLLAVRHLLDKGKFDPALALAEDVLKADAEDSDALEIAAIALEGKMDARAAVSFSRRLFRSQVARQDMPAAAESLWRLLRLLPRPEEAETETRQYLASLAPSDMPAVEAGRLLLARLRGTNPAAHRWLTGFVESQTPLSPVLMPPPGALGLDDPLPLPLSRPDWNWSARQLVEAVEQNEARKVSHARTALEQVRASDPPTFARIWAALEHASGDDPSRLVPLRGRGRKGIVVDASNVAWFDQESLVHGKPRLRHLTAMRRALRARGFFPVVLYADANLPYFIDDPAGLRAMRDRGELTLVDAGTQADEVLVRMAKTGEIPLVTNDRMEDWDPIGEVRKVRYAIAMSGDVHLLTEI